MVSFCPIAIVDSAAATDSVVPSFPVPVVPVAAVSDSVVVVGLAPAVLAIMNPAVAVAADTAAVAIRVRVRGLRMMCLPVLVHGRTRFTCRQRLTRRLRYPPRSLARGRYVAARSGNLVGGTCAEPRGRPPVEAVFQGIGCAALTLCCRFAFAGRGQ